MNIIIIDDDKLVTTGIQTILEMQSQQEKVKLSIQAIGHNGMEAIQLASIYQPDLMLLDIRMPEMDGIRAGKEILKIYPDIKIIYLTTFQEDSDIIEALKLGAKGYLLKTDFSSLLPSLIAVYNGQRVFGDEIIAKIPDYIGNTDRNATLKSSMYVDELNNTETAILYNLSQGMNNKEIAEIMHFSEGTIRNYISTMLEKLHLRDRTQLAIFYYKHLHSTQSIDKE